MPDFSKLLRSLAAIKDLNRKGFTISDEIIGLSAVDALNGVYQKYAEIFPSKGVSNTIILADSELKNAIHNEIAPILKNWIDITFKNYKIALIALYIKHGNSYTIGHMHQDPTIVETQGKAVSVWIPLSNVDERKGSLGFVPYSHKIFKGLQDKTTSLPYNGPITDFKKYLISVVLKAGQAVIFDNNTIHTSMPYPESGLRVAVGLKIVDKDARMCTIYEQRNMQWKLFHNDDFYYDTRWNDSFEMPQTYIAKEKISALNRKINKSEFAIRWNLINIF